MEKFEINDTWTYGVLATCVIGTEVTQEAYPKDQIKAYTEVARPEVTYTFKCLGSDTKVAFSDFCKQGVVRIISEKGITLLPAYKITSMAINLWDEPQPELAQPEIIPEQIAEVASESVTVN